MTEYTPDSHTANLAAEATLSMLLGWLKRIGAKHQIDRCSETLKIVRAAIAETEGSPPT